ncbi:MAG: pantoate--beta-alanine ligase [Fimbriimonadaceae bacterium]|nr:pantoate--beta-alanine ligase [Fimbriimonadaceae bacterium]
MQQFSDPDHLRTAARGWRREGRRIGFVPTMGNLHEGHLSLLRRAAAECDVALLSVYVNPKQFGPQEDFANYPRTLAEDLALAASAGCSDVFVPTDATIYPPGFATSVTVAGLTEPLCGRSRPGHFAGVTTVVAKLFCLVVPDRAYFGEKDYQQLQVIRRLTADLGLGTEVVGCPIVREADGLAMSSRNRYLNPAERAAAVCLSRAIAAAQRVAADGADAAETILAAAQIVLARQPLARIDYLELVNPETLQPLARLDRPARLILAVQVGPARLLDNGPIEPAESKPGPLLSLS